MSVTRSLMMSVGSGLTSTYATLFSSRIGYRLHRRVTVTARIDRDDLDIVFEAIGRPPGRIAGGYGSERRLHVGKEVAEGVRDFGLLV